MSSDEVHAFCEQMRSTDRALSTMVRINHHEVTMIVVRELILRRNSDLCKMDSRDAFDQILRSYYLTKDEFEKYVINKEEIPNE